MMKINGMHLNNVNPYNKTQQTAPLQKPSASLKDKVEISSEAKDLQITSEYRDQRAERLKELKAAIESNEYKVDARQVAEDILKYYRL